MKVAAIDLGTNSFLCLIAEGSKGKIDRILSDEVQITRLGEGVHHTREFSKKALERAEETFKDFVRSIQKFGVEKVCAVATSAARDVHNKDMLIALGSKYGIPIEVISGEQEAKLTFTGAMFDVAETSGIAIVDVGGGSTEFIFKKDSLLHAKSLDIGAVRLTELFAQSINSEIESDGRVSPLVLEKMRDYARSEIKRLKPIACTSVLGVAGTPTALASAIQNQEFDEKKINQTVLSQKVLDKWLVRLAEMSNQERANLKGIGIKRADIIVAGTLLLCEALRFLRCAEMTVSTRGLRYGLAIEMLTG